MNEKELLAVLIGMQDIMRSVSTGGARIDEVNGTYKTLWLDADVALSHLGIDNPIQFVDLWEWYGRWSSGDLPSYQSRRNYLTDLFDPLLRVIRDYQSGVRAEIEEPTGWTRVDRNLDGMRRQLAQAENEEAFQQVGLLGREALISLAQAVFDPSLQDLEDGVQPSATDARRMLDAFIAARLPGSNNEARRRHVKASIALANELQHQRTASFRDAALCAEATSSVVNSIAIISGNRDPSPGVQIQIPNHSVSTESVRELINTLNDFYQQQAELEGLPGAAPMFFFVGGPETDDRERWGQRTDCLSALREWSERVRETLSSNAVEFLADWDAAELNNRADVLRTFIQELRRRL